MRQKKRFGLGLLGTSVFAAPAFAERVVITAVDVTSWTIDDAGRAILSLHSGQRVVLLPGTFAIVDGQLQPLPFTGDNQTSQKVSPDSIKASGQGPWFDVTFLENSTSWWSAAGISIGAGMSGAGLAYLAADRNSTNSSADLDAVAQGPQGPQGPTGPQGETGLQGPTGAQGPIGPTGAVGQQGIDGVAGPEGPVGPQGPQGLQGAIGPQGENGADGQNGADGNSNPFITGGAIDFVTAVSGLAGTFHSFGVSDIDGDTVTLELSTVHDGSLFSLDTQGNLSFVQVPVFADGGGNSFWSDLFPGDSIYALEVVAIDGVGGSFTQELVVQLVGPDSSDVAVDRIFPNQYLFDGAENDAHLTGSSANDSFVFGSYTGNYDASLVIDTGDGDDFVSFGDFAFMHNSSLTINGGNGSNTFEFGRQLGYDDSLIQLLAGDGDQTVRAGIGAVLDGGLLIDFGDGDHDLSFGQDSASSNGHINIRLGNGDHVVRFDEMLISNTEGRVDLDTGEGASTISFGEMVGYGTSSYDRFGVFIDLGTNLDQDTISFEGSGYDGGLRGSVTITNWQIGTDALIEIHDESLWVGSYDNDDLIFSHDSSYGDPSITFVGLAGESTDPLDYFI